MGNCLSPQNNYKSQAKKSWNSYDDRQPKQIRDSIIAFSSVSLNSLNKQNKNKEGTVQDKNSGIIIQVQNDDEEQIHNSRIATSKIYKRNANSVETNNNAPANAINKKKSRQKQQEEYQNQQHEQDQFQNIRKTTSSQMSQQVQLNIDQQNIDQIMQGVIKQQLQQSKITLYNSKVALQFTIPKQRAGPVIVPFIDYELICIHDGQEDKLNKQIQ